MIVISKGFEIKMFCFYNLMQYNKSVITVVKMA